MKLPKIRFNFKKIKFSWTSLGQWLLRIVAIGIAVVAVLFLVYSRDLPDPNQLLQRQVPESTKIYARDGSLLYEIHGEVKRTLIPYSEMNDNIKHATISIEDKNFYNEGGINFKGIARSALADVFHLGAAQGGSTITQQFVKNAILTNQKSISRKIKEWILSIEINEKFSKDDILKLYLNEIPYGHNAYGIEAAAQTYYGIHAKDLTLAQSAYLAAMVQAPSYYNPAGSHRTELDNRKNLVLSLMQQQGYITQDQLNAAKNDVVSFAKPHDSIIAPHFVQYIEGYLSTKYGESTLQQGGLKVTTTLDPKLQKIAEQVVKDDVTKEEKPYNTHNAALVAIDPKTGQILAMVGSKDYFGDPVPAGCKPNVNCTFEPNFNIATDGIGRQPGSSAKPYVYATAFKPQFHMSPATMLMDVTTNFGSYGGQAYIPKNFTGANYGPVSIRQALAGSLNIPAVKTLDLVGVDNATQTMRDFGITSPLKNCGLSLVLGGCEVHLLDHVSGFTTIATEGIHHPETGILEIDDASGNVLEKFQDNPQQVIDPQSAYELISIMTDNNARAFVFGLHSPLTLPDRPVAAKTGTSQNFRDGWTLGFTPSLAAGVWAGNNDGSFTKADGVVIAGPIWHDFMVQATKGTPTEDFPVPAGIKQVTVDSVSGKLPNPYTPTTKTETFASFSVPTTTDDVHQVYAVPVAQPTPAPTPIVDQNGNPQPQNSNNPSNNPSGNSTAPDQSAQTTNQLFTILHSERPDNPNWENPVVAWATAHGYSYPPPGAVRVDAPPSSTAPGPSSNTPGNPPVVKITAPQDGSTVQVPFVLQASATPDPNNSIIKVDLLIDGTFIRSQASAPYDFSINGSLPPGSHSFAVRAIDDKNNSSNTSVTLTVK